ncbi:helix-turn-helix transcriptional regulator [Euzebya sp.]|uniref:helix-turn-helix transcriptional regulator n=1 Tax=Euzebya sp. TaxID=1971409 RepID=UPI0035155C23
MSRLDLELLAGQHAPALAAHLIAAITAYRRRLVDAGLPDPAGLADVIGQLRSSAARSGQVPALPPPAVHGAGVTTLLTYADAEARTGLSESTLRRRVRDGSLPAVRLGGAVRFDPADLDAAIERAKGTAA